MTVQSVLNKESKHWSSPNHYGFKRIKPLCADNNDITFSMAFTRAWVDYIHSKGHSIASVCRAITADGRIKLTEGGVQALCAGQNRRYVYLYKLQLMAEYVGLNLMDFVTIKQPHLQTDTSED